MLFLMMQVASEAGVLVALASWVQARPEERTSLFEDMFGKQTSEWYNAVHGRLSLCVFICIFDLKIGCKTL